MQNLEDDPHRVLIITFVMIEIKVNSKVSVHYTGRLADGQVFDSSEGREPLTFTVGAGQLIKGFEDGVMGMKVNESKTLNISSEEAYGPRREELIQVIEKAMLPKDLDPQVGQKLASQGTDGRQMVVNVTAVDDSTITIDGNHELAGRDLIFDIEVISIQ